MKRIGIIDLDRLVNIPERYWAQHEFCFHLHDLMLGLLTKMEREQAAAVSFPLESDSEHELLSDGLHVLDFLEQTGRGDLEKRVVINHLSIALYADILNFLYEGLRALEKRKFSVALSLFRKPFKEGLLIAAQVCGNEDEFFHRMKFGANKILGREDLQKEKVISYIEQAIMKCKGSRYVDAELIYSIAFDRGNYSGLAPLFDKATHLVTDFSKIRTENYNINFIFKDARDNDVYDDGVYEILSKLLLFMNLMQIEIYSRMSSNNKKYQNWMMFTSLGAYEALFSKGSPRLCRFINRNFGEFLLCSVCGGPLKIRKRDAARFFIGETIDCNECDTSQHFPLGWLLSKMNINLFDS
ncbi:MAG TPA: hypothetical protein DHW36_10095 [Thalassospira sp.]|nr:hypothetical protein [Thalassospira sp.]HCK18855.1 hypothetical protein [Thalassospira sp.]|tara:strand:- start:2421 stop:3485 length:1065 start_codon:yes stop_codon:yes gene_type:complete